MLNISESLDDLFQLICLRLYGDAVAGSDFWSFVRSKLPDIGRSVGELSDLYTRNRPAVHRSLLRSPEHRQAYFWYFLPTNFFKIQLILEELWRHEGAVQLLSGPIHILDVGCGPGTNLLGAVDFLSRRSTVSRRVRCVGVDCLESNLQDTRFFLNRWPAPKKLGEPEGHSWNEIGTPVIISAQTERHDLETECDLRNLGRFHFVILGNLLNELFVAEPDRILKRASMIAGLIDQCLLPQGFLVLIEPALKNTSRELLLLRNQLITTLGLNVYAPCVHNSDCPAVGVDNREDWCHESVPWSEPPIIREIDERIGNRKSSLKFSYVVLSRNDLSVRDVGRQSSCLKSDERLWRVVSERLEEAGKLSLYLCGSTGRFKVTRLNKHMDEVNKAFSRLDRGQVVATGALSFKSPSDARVHAGTPVSVVTGMPDAAN